MKCSEFRLSPFGRWYRLVPDWRASPLGNDKMRSFWVPGFRHVVTLGVELGDASEIVSLCVRLDARWLHSERGVAPAAADFVASLLRTIGAGDPTSLSLVSALGRGGGSQSDDRAARPDAGHEVYRVLTGRQEEASMHLATGLVTCERQDGWITIEWWPAEPKRVSPGADRSPPIYRDISAGQMVRSFW